MPARKSARTAKSPSAKTARTPQRQEKLLTPGEVAELFRVDPKTVGRWAAAGKLNSIRTLGGHRRFFETEVRKKAGLPPAERLDV